METRALKQAVRRNLDRFPADFMFELVGEEAPDMVSQNVIPEEGGWMMEDGGEANLALTGIGGAFSLTPSWNASPI